MLFSAFGNWLSSLAAPPSPVRVGRRRRRAATAMEYLFVLSLIFIVAMTAINYFAQQTKKTFENSGATIKQATEGSNSSGS